MGRLLRRAKHDPTSASTTSAAAAATVSGSGLGCGAAMPGVRKPRMICMDGAMRHSLIWIVEVILIPNPPGAGSIKVLG